MKTISKVQTVTNTQILTATFALLLANGFALVSLPTKSVGVTPVVGCNVRLTQSYFCQLKKGISGYRQFTYTCPNGKSFQVNGACRTVDSVRQMALKACKESKACVAPKAALRADTIPAKVLPKASPSVPSQKQISTITKTISAPPVPYVDLAFIGKLEENILVSPDGKYGATMTVRYNNRGPVNLPSVDQVEGGTDISITFLDEQDNIVSFEPESFYVPEGFSFRKPLPVVISGQTAETIFSFPSVVLRKMQEKQIYSIKVELRVGERKVGATGVFDPNIENNVMIIPVSSIFSVVK